MLEIAKNEAAEIINTDPDLLMAENLPLKAYLDIQKGKTVWSKIS